jgi:hypothetical protein
MLMPVYTKLDGSNTTDIKFRLRYNRLVACTETDMLSVARNANSTFDVVVSDYHVEKTRMCKLSSKCFSSTSC